SSKLEESPDAVPAKETLDQGTQHAEPAAQDAIKTATQDAIAQSNLKVEQPKPVELPHDKVESTAASEEAAPAAKPVAKFSVQLGSYPSKKEAQLKIGTLVKRGLKPEIRVAVVNNETRYRVVLPGFKTKQLADARGKDLKTRRKIENFVTIKSE
ncbi:MAG: SPOR domain-containing protein, partial [Bdellovibrionales bacterium]|nr:SPOR domain-containing protein [Oligoflexia bacterium]